MWYILYVTPIIYKLKKPTNNSIYGVVPKVIYIVLSQLKKRIFLFGLMSHNFMAFKKNTLTF